MFGVGVVFGEAWGGRLRVLDELMSTCLVNLKDVDPGKGPLCRTPCPSPRRP